MNLLLSLGLEGVEEKLGQGEMKKQQRQKRKRNGSVQSLAQPEGLWGCTQEPCAGGALSRVGRVPAAEGRGDGRRHRGHREPSTASVNQ